MKHDVLLRTKWYFVLFISVLIFAIIGYKVYTGQKFSIDYQINSYIPHIQTDSLTLIARVIAYAFDTATLLIISFIFAAYLIYKFHRKKAIFFAATMICDAILVTLSKNFFQVSRPSNAIMSETSFSFPSGHSLTSVVFLGLLLYIYWPIMKKQTKLILSIACAGLILIIGFTRVYLNVHWVSDVLGGYALGVVLLISSLYLYGKV
jgi:undecaprenyl-diphosphatase